MEDVFPAVVAELVLLLVVAGDEDEFINLPRACDFCGEVVAPDEAAAPAATGGPVRNLPRRGGGVGAAVPPAVSGGGGVIVLWPSTQ